MEGDGVWQQLDEITNISNYQPAQVQGVVHRQLESNRDGTYYMLNNARAGSYLKLDPKDFYVWTLMDGTRSVKQLVVAYFTEFGSIAFARVTDLVTQLKAAGFLTDRPVNVYAEVRRQRRKASLSYRGAMMWRAFLQKEMAIGGLDGIVTRMYRSGFWIFFTKPAFLLYPFMALAGLGLFIYTIQAKDYPLLSLGGSLWIGLVTYLGANIIMVMVHEGAHALTTKRYQRKVRKGGAMVYFGSLAFFVDTMDVWMEPKRARILVSWAGPFSSLLLGSVAMFIIAGMGFPDSDMVLAAFLFRLALVSFVLGALMNMNPLLEWDGYFMLMDWLEIPRLRKRSIRFVKRELFNKIATRASFSQEEKIFAVFGVFAFVYSILIIGVILFIWQSRVSGILSKASDLSGWLPWLLIGLLVVFIGVPVGMALGTMLYKRAQRIRHWAYRHFFIGRPTNQVVGLGIAAVVVALPSLFLADSTSDVYSSVAGGLALALGLVVSIRLVPWYLGSQLQWFFLAIPWVVGLLLVAQILSPLDGSVSTTATVVAHGIAVALLLSLVYLSPTLISFNRTALQGAWGLLASGVTVLGLAALVAVATTGAGAETYVHFLAVLGYGTLAAALLRLHNRLRSLDLEQPGGAATRFLVEGTLHPFVQTLGRRALSRLEKQFNEASAAGADGAFLIRDGKITDTGEGSLVERSQAYSVALSQFFSLCSAMMGGRFIRRQIRELHRTMPWEEREIGQEYLFPRLDFMTGVHQAFATTTTGHVSLLRSAPLFKSLGDDDLRVISDRLRSETYPKEKDIIKQGEPGRTFYIIESGTVEVWVRQEDGTEFLAVELGRGDYFGERALLNDAPRAATCRCKTRVQVLSLEKGGL